MRLNVFAFSILFCGHSLLAEEKIFSKLVGDFNSDGFPDLALTDPKRCGNAGCWWTIYMGKKDGLLETEAVTLFFHPLAINLSKKKNGTTVTTYYRSGGGEGLLVELKIKGSKISKISERTIYPDDNGNVDDQSLYRDMFGSLRNHRLDKKITKAEYREILNKIEANQAVVTIPAAPLPPS